jgi:hypothetical protein
MAGWKFRELRRGDKDRQPTQGEFFSTDAIRSVAEALVREAIQNSLDASLKNGEPVVVRFHLGRVPRSVALKYFADGWPHFSAPGNGLDSLPGDDEDCEFIAVEDFGTTGLTGDVTQWRHDPGTKNPFYYFFRTEGRSGKGEADRGRWGIGKYVFPRSSRINALMAITVRSDDKQRLLMGQAVLKSHVVGDAYFTPDGDYGVGGSDGFVVPSADEVLLSQFTADFSLERNSKSGLSVVVPWLRADEIERRAIMLSVVEDYFFPILCGNLRVTISDDNGVSVVDKDSLPSASAEIGEEFEREMLPLLKLAEWARDQAAENMWVLNAADRHRPSWKESLLPDDLLSELREAFRKGERIAVRVPLTVREKGKQERESFFDIYLVNDGGGDGAPVFIRDGIIISDVRARRVSGVRALVIINDPPLAHLLGDSENPAHTQWQRDREHFKYKYYYGTSYIDFVSQAVATLVRYLNQSDEEPDRDLLKDVFSLPKPPESNAPKEKSKARKPNAGDTIPPDVKTEPTKRRFSLSKVVGGFTIGRGHADAVMPSLLRIATAYDRRTGSPLKKYSPEDFDFDQLPITVEPIGATVVTKKFNRMLIRVNEPDFKITATGFDENRDLFVDVRVEEVGSD